MKPESPLPRLVIFDCDGTLIDSSWSNRLFYNRVKAALGLPPLTPEEEAFSYVQTVDSTLRRIVPREMLERAFEQAATADWKSLSQHIRLQPGVLEFTRFLKGQRILTAVNTNSGREVRTILDRLGVRLLFQVIVSSDDVSRPKPDPEGVGKILARLGVRPREMVYIGDSEIDRLTAHKAGVEFWAYRAPELTAKRHFDHFDQLRGVFSPE